MRTPRLHRKFHDSLSQHEPLSGVVGIFRNVFSSIDLIHTAPCRGRHQAVCNLQGREALVCSLSLWVRTLQVVLTQVLCSLTPCVACL